MTALLWAARVMTVLAIVGTIHEAMFGDRFALVLVGLLLSWGGIILLAISDKPPRGIE